MKLILTILCLFMCLESILMAQEHPFPLTDSEKKYLITNPIVKYTSDPNWLPYEAFDKNGKHIGIVSDILKIIEKKLDIKFEIVLNNSWEEALTLAQNGEIDMITSDPSDLALQKKL